MDAATTTRWLALALALGCSGRVNDITEEPPEGYTAGSETPPQPTEAQQLERAKQHPTAHPEPRPVYPEKQPPPLPERGLPEKSPPPQSTSAPLLTPPEAPAVTSEPPRTVTAPSEPPAPRYETRPPPPTVTYVWAPGYWYWYGGDYVWIDGVWLPPRPGYTYVGARWVFGNGRWSFVAGGWASSGTGVVVYPLHRHDYLYRPSHHHQRGHARRSHGPGHSPRRGSVRPPRTRAPRSRPGGTTTVRARRR